MVPGVKIRNEDKWPDISDLAGHVEHLGDGLVYDRRCHCNNCTWKRSPRVRINIEIIEHIAS